MYRRPFQNNRKSNFSRNDYGYKKEDSKLHDHSICVCSHDHSIKKEFLIALENALFELFSSEFFIAIKAERGKFIYAYFSVLCIKAVSFCMVMF